MQLRTILDDTIESWRRERPDLEFDAMATTLRMNQLMMLALRAADQLFAPFGITLGEFDVLAAIRRSGPGAALTPTTLARVAMVSPGGMTNRLNRLEAAGLIVRAIDPQDRRGSRVALTPAGFDVADRSVEALAAVENDLFSSLSATERQRFDRILDKLIAQLDS